MSIELKIKAKSLQEEARIIRKEEDKLKRLIDWVENVLFSEALDERDTWLSLKQHRRWDVRNEARATHLARAFLANQRYSDVEKPKLNSPDTDGHLMNRIVPRITTMVNKYGRIPYTLTDSHIRDWVSG